MTVWNSMRIIPQRVYLPSRSYSFIDYFIWIVRIAFFSDVRAQHVFGLYNNCLQPRSDRLRTSLDVDTKPKTKSAIRLLAKVNKFMAWRIPFKVISVLKLQTTYVSPTPQRTPLAGFVRRPKTSQINDAQESFPKMKNLMCRICTRILLRPGIIYTTTWNMSVPRGTAYKYSVFSLLTSLVNCSCISLYLYRKHFFLKLDLKAFFKQYIDDHTNIKIVVW